MSTFNATSPSHPARSASFHSTSHSGANIHFSHGYSPPQHVRSKKRAQKDPTAETLQTLQKVQDQVDAQGFFDIIGDFWKSVLNRFGYHTQPLQKKVTPFNPPQDFQDQFFKILNLVKNKPSSRTNKKLSSFIVGYFKKVDEKKEKDKTPTIEEMRLTKEWVDQKLKENLGEAQQKTIQKATKGWEKRVLQQSQPMQLSFGLPQRVFPITFPPTGLSLCASGTSAVIASNTAYALPELSVMLFTLGGTTMTPMTGVSQAINDQLLNLSNPSIASYDPRMACGPDGYFHILTLGAPLYHTILINQTLKTPYAILPPLNSSTPVETWNIAKLPGNGAVFASSPGEDCYLAMTNTSGTFSGYGTLLNNNSYGNDAPCIFSFDDGSFRVLQNRFIPPGLFEIPFDASGIVGSITETNNAQRIGKLLGPITPIPLGTRFISLITPNGYTSSELPAVFTYDLVARQIISARALSTGSGFFASIAICPPPDTNIFLTARDCRGICIDVIDASQNSSSILQGGEQIYGNFSTSVLSRIGCLSNKMGMLTYIDDQNVIQYLTFQYLPIPPAPPTPISSPATQSAASTPPPNPTQSPTTTTTNQTFVYIGSLTSIGINSTPITQSQVILDPTFAAGANSTLSITSTGGYTIVYTSTGQPVNLNTPFPALSIYNMSISHTNTSDTTPPVFEGCEESGVCATSQLASLFDISPSDPKDPINWPIIGPIIGVSIGTLAIVMGLVARFAWWPWHKQWKLRNEKAWHAQKPPV